MEDLDQKIEQLNARLENLFKYQEYFQREIAQIRYEINVLRAVQQKRSGAAQPTAPPPRKPPVREYIPPARTEQNAPPNFTQETSPQTENSKAAEFPAQPVQPKEKSDLEKFIGENLLSKIGIVILVLGVAIGAKYAIDNNLISPLMRIVLGYAFGTGLTALAVRLKTKYHNFSAVLLSGGMAIMYFITYAAYGYYELIAQPAAFALMLIFTAFTVATALIYERVVIAHIGLVGAYTIPFLLSDDSGRVAFLFSYMAIINAGILIISVRKYWKSLFYSSFVITWLIFGGWFAARYAADDHFSLALAFATVFFVIFYLTFLSYKIVFREEISFENISLVTANSFIYYGFGSAIIESLPGGKEFLGSFAVANAALHFAAAFLLSRLATVKPGVIFLPSALVLVFITLAVPVQLEGNWITPAWTAQAAVLFAMGRTRRLPLYEYFSYPVMVLASVSLFNDWQRQFAMYSSNELAQYPVFNVDFLVTIFFVAAFGLIYSLNKNEKYEPAVNEYFHQLSRIVFPIVLLVALYNAFRIEIGNYFQYQTVSTAVRDAARSSVLVDRDLELFNLVWQIDYTMFFLSLLAFANLKRYKNAALGFANLGLCAAVLLIFLTAGLFTLGALRESYLLQTDAAAFSRGIYHISIRYISLGFAAGLIFAVYKYFRRDFIREHIADELLALAFDFLFYFSLLVIVSSELLHWMEIFGYEDSAKLGLSILWGVYSLGLIVVGIARHKKHLRIAAIALFALTLVKLFFYDIAELGTISKTVVFVSLGILLLVISFLYNKYKNLIFGANRV